MPRLHERRKEIVDLRARRKARRRHARTLRDFRCQRPATVVITPPVEVKITGITGAGLFAGTVFSGVPSLSALTGSMPIMTDAKGVLIHDVTRCVACRRCELACSEFNDGTASSYLARVKVGRNMQWGAGASAGTVILVV